MLKPPHPAAVLGYVTAMLINPNNHALDGGPATAAMEKEVVARLAGMFGAAAAPGAPDLQRHHRQPRGPLRRARVAPGQGHRLQRRRPLHARAHVPRARRRGHRRRHRRARADGPGGTRAGCSHRADRHRRRHPRHHRARCPRPAAGDHRARPAHGVAGACRRRLRRLLRAHRRRLPRRRRQRPLRRDRATRTRSSSTRTSTACSRTAAARCCSPTPPSAASTSTTPRTPTSAPTSCTSGEISLECSRAGAAAAALWLTLEVLPLTADGLGAALRPGRRGALDWHGLLERSPRPCAPTSRPSSTSSPTCRDGRRCPPSTRRAQAVFRVAGEGDPRQQVHVATYVVSGDQLRARGLDPRAGRRPRHGSCAACS